MTERTTIEMQFKEISSVGLAMANAKGWAAEVNNYIFMVVQQLNKNNVETYMAGYKKKAISAYHAIEPIAGGFKTFDGAAHACWMKYLQLNHQQIQEEQENDENYQSPPKITEH